MKTAIKTNPAGLTAVGLGALALAAAAFSGAAQARSDVAFSVSVGLPGVQLVSSNGYPVYSQPRPVFVAAPVQVQPVYVQPGYLQHRPVYVQAAPVYLQPRPVFYGQRQVYAAPQAVYYVRPHGWHNGRGWGPGRYDGDQRGHGQGQVQSGWNNNDHEQRQGNWDGVRQIGYQR